MDADELAEVMADTQERCRKDPRFFFEDVLNMPRFVYEGKQHTHWEKIIEICESVRDNPETYVKSGHGTGKTHGAAGITLWFLFSHPDSMVITTAPTERQVKEVLWSEIGRQYQKELLGGTFTNLKIELNEGWKALGFTARESVDQEKMAARMQGFHSAHMLVIFDEAPGVHPAFWLARKGAATGGHSRFLAIGNPTSPTGDFYDNCLRHGAITLSCLDHPNVISGEEIIPGAVTRQWITDRKEEWGEDSPLYKSRVLGEFPDEGEDTLIPLSLANAAAEREEFNEQGKLKALGVDVARFGSDTTVLLSKEGRNQGRTESYNGKDLNWTLAKIKEMDEEIQHDVIVVDDTGVGGGITDGLKGWKRESDGKSPIIIPVNFGETAQGGFFDSVEFQNLKAEIFWLLKFDFQNNNIKIRGEGRMIPDCCSLKYEYTGKLEIAIIGKEAMRKKGLKSPDFADALALANYGTHQKMNMVSESMVEKSPTIGGNIMQQEY